MPTIWFEGFWDHLTAVNPPHIISYMFRFIGFQKIGTDRHFTPGNPIFHMIDACITCVKAKREHWCYRSFLHFILESGQKPLNVHADSMTKLHKCVANYARATGQIYSAVLEKTLRNIWGILIGRGASQWLSNQQRVVQCKLLFDGGGFGISQHLTSRVHEIGRSMDLIHSIESGNTFDTFDILRQADGIVGIDYLEVVRLFGQRTPTRRPEVPGMMRKIWIDKLCITGIELQDEFYIITSDLHVDCMFYNSEAMERIDKEHVYCITLNAYRGRIAGFTFGGFKKLQSITINSCMSPLELDLHDIGIHESCNLKIYIDFYIPHGCNTPINLTSFRNRLPRRLGCLELIISKRATNSVELKLYELFFGDIFEKVNLICLRFTDNSFWAQYLEPILFNLQYEYGTVTSLHSIRAIEICSYASVMSRELLRKVNIHNARNLPPHFIHQEEK